MATQLAFGKHQTSSSPILPMDQLQPLHYPFQQMQPVWADAFVNPTWLNIVSNTKILFTHVTKTNIQTKKQQNLNRYRLDKMCRLANKCANGLPYKLNLWSRKWDLSITVEKFHNTHPNYIFRIRDIVYGGQTVIHFS